jgi:uncharacterized membrane protein YcaP (DUF421 family)
VEVNLFESWAGLVRVLVNCVVGYTCVIAILRISGKRTLSKLNAFDFVVTIALGSTLATLIVSKDMILAEGVLAVALLVSLQYIITAASVRSSLFSGLVKSEPTLLAHDGIFLKEAMLKQRVTPDEVLAALRAHKLEAIEDAAAVVLETDGSISVLPRRND